MPAGVKVPTDGAVDQHLDLLVAGAEVAPLGGAEADPVGAGRQRRRPPGSNEPVPCRKATWLPCGAPGLPQVKPLPLPATPAPPVKVQAEPVGRYW